MTPLAHLSPCFLDPFLGLMKPPVQTIRCLASECYYKNCQGLWWLILIVSFIYHSTTQLVFTFHRLQFSSSELDLYFKQKCWNRTNLKWHDIRIGIPQFLSVVNITWWQLKDWSNSEYHVLMVIDNIKWEKQWNFFINPQYKKLYVIFFLVET